MGTTLNKESYEKLIFEDIEKLEEFFPKYSLEKSHIKAVLLDSIDRLYNNNKQK